MSIPELDLKKVNLQAAVGYLISLHDNEVDWNLLGIKVIGHIDALPIPEGTYEYGDAYMVGTETSYDMYVYSRPDGNVHTEGYWFPIGKFPAPGPQGPKGDGLEQINKWTNGTVSNITYDITDGAKVIQKTTVDYTDSTDGSTKQQQFDTTTNLPIFPGKYISMDTNADNDAVKIKVDDIALSADYFKIPDKTNSTIGYAPIYKSGKVQKVNLTIENSAGAIVQRGPKGEAGFESIMSKYWYREPSSPDRMYFSNVYNQVVTSEHNINKSVTNTGTMPALHISYLQNLPQRHIQYNNQVYYRMSPMDAPDGTLNYIHIDSIQDGNGGHKATGKCFSINVDTRIWKVFDLDFGGSTRTTHNLKLTDSSSSNIYFSLTNNRTETYEGSPAGLLNAIKNSRIACTVISSGVCSAGIITTNGNSFKVNYGDGVQMTMGQENISITDNMM